MFFNSHGSAVLLTELLLSSYLQHKTIPHGELEAWLRVAAEYNYPVIREWINTTLSQLLLGTKITFHLTEQKEERGFKMVTCGIHFYYEQLPRFKGE